MADEGSSEHARIARLRRIFAGQGAPLPAGALGIGDDAAVMPPTRRRRVYTVDASVEGVHFSRALLPLDQAAARAVTAAVSDLAAMGASVEGGGLLSALTLPRSLPDGDLDALITGVARASRRYGLPVLGGNLSSGPCISLTTTVVGTLPRGPGVTRAGAKPGDLLFVSGIAGRAALGLRLLQGPGPRPDGGAAARAIRAWVAPRAHLGEGAALAGVASAMIDLSDGLASDAGHVARASGCALVLDASALLAGAAARACDEAARAAGASLLDLALRGGEDYLLLAAVPDDPKKLARLPRSLRRVGVCQAGEGVWLRDAPGLAPRPVEGGFDHFSSGGSAAHN